MEQADFFFHLLVKGSACVERNLSFLFVPAGHCDYSEGAGPEESPNTNSAEISYSRPCGFVEHESSFSASAAICPSTSRWMSTVVIEGLLYSARRVLSNPVTEMSCGTRQPAFINPLITPTAVRSLTAITAVGRRDNPAIAKPAASPPSKRKSPGRIRPGSNPSASMHFSYACSRTTLDFSRRRPATKAKRRCPLMHSVRIAREAGCRACSSGNYRRRLPAESTTLCVRRPTLPVLFNTLETVAVDTPAALAPSRMVRPITPSSRRFDWLRSTPPTSRASGLQYR